MAAGDLGLLRASAGVLALYPYSFDASTSPRFATACRTVPPT